jgi:hypothetical protein
MSYELILKEEADREVLEGYCWYQRQQSDLENLFWKKSRST